MMLNINKKSSLITKRIFDFVLAFMCLVFLAPAFALTALLVRIHLGSPVLFKQQRPGLYENPFWIYKFRTMTEARDSSGSLLQDEVRLTPMGKFLRKFSLDELPQLFNVLKGDLSLVGPRPLLTEYLPLYSPEQARRHLVKPGITGWAQINGRNNIEWEDKFALDVWYVDNYSFWLDLQILCKTVLKVFKTEDISQSGHATMPDFTGTKGNFFKSM